MDLSTIRGFGPVRLKVLLWLTRTPALDVPNITGSIVGHVTGGSVKMAFHEQPREVRIEDEKHDEAA